METLAISKEGQHTWSSVIPRDEARYGPGGGRSSHPRPFWPQVRRSLMRRVDSLEKTLMLGGIGHLMRRVDSLEKTLMLGGIRGRRKRG